MNIIFTCAGRRTNLLKYFRENMEKDDLIIATDMQLTAPALQVADIKLQVPGVYSNDYIDELLNNCSKYNVDALISLNDLELPILAENKSLFKALGVKVIVSDPEVIDICFDKYKTSQWIKSIGLNSPKTYINLDVVKDDLAKGNLEFPLFMKPRWGSGSIGLEIINDLEELDIYYNLISKKIKKSILSNASIGDEYIIIQEKLLGDEFGVDIMNDLNGKNVGVSIKQKLAMRAGETDKALTINNPDIELISKKIGSRLKHIGNLDVDIMQHSNGNYYVLELNPRFGGGFPFSYEAGVNMPKAIIEWIKGNEIDTSILKPVYDKLFAKNDFLIEIK